MSLVVVRLYAEVAVLLAAALGLGASVRRLAERIAGAQPARRWVRLAHALLGAAFALPLLARLALRPDAIFPAPMQVSSGAGEQARLAVAFFPPLPAAAASIPGSGGGWLVVLAVALLTLSAAGLARLAMDTWRLLRLCRAAIPVRVVGGVRVSISSQAAAPFSVALGRRAWVVLPERFVLAPQHLRLALAHELAHVRARDTAWAYLTAFAVALLPWHPAARVWARAVARLHELACDERVAGRRGVSPRAYAECLVWAAESAAGGWRMPGVAVPMLEGSRAFMERRIDMVLSRSSLVSRRGFLVPALGGAALALLAGASTVSHGAVADRRVSADELRAIADDLAKAHGFRVPVDATLAEEVNQVIGDATLRAKFREGLTRLATYRPLGEEALRRHGVPVELLAIPQVESRLQPLPATANRLGCAGRWQFLPATARSHGLRIEGGTDDRFDQTREAEAAATFLAELYADLHDWPLAIAAYNHGRPRVQAVMARTGLGDAAALVKSGALTRYSSQVLAAMLLIHRPALLD
jgi:hypothetical protein